MLKASSQSTSNMVCLIRLMDGLLMTTIELLHLWLPIGDLMCGLVIVEEISIQENMSGIIQIRINNSGSSLSNIWPIMTFLQFSPTSTTTLNKKYTTLDTVKEPSKCSLPSQSETQLLKNTWISTLPSALWLMLKTQSPTLSVSLITA